MDMLLTPDVGKRWKICWASFKDCKNDVDVQPWLELEFVLISKQGTVWEERA